MKLLFCPLCWDVKKLTRKEERQCKCGRARGRAIEDGKGGDQVWVTGAALVLGLNNLDLDTAARNRWVGGDAEIPLNCWLFEKGYRKISIVEDPPELPGKMIELGGLI